MKRFIYAGYRPDGPGSAIVAFREVSQRVERADPVEETKTGQALPPRTDVRNHSPDGFEWGYAGSGPAQLALALCIHALTAIDDADDAARVERAQRVYQDVKFKLIAPIQQSSWVLSSDQVIEAIGKVEAHWDKHNPGDRVAAHATVRQAAQRAAEQMSAASDESPEHAS